MPEVFGAERQQIRHDLAGQVHLVVHYHVLQVGNADRLLIQGLQALQGKPRSRARPMLSWLITGEKPASGALGLTIQAESLGVLHIVSALQLRQLVSRKDAGLG